MPDTIFIKGAREHNLKNIDVSIPREKLVVITGASGSGKSSLAFDTIYAEGQRRYVESLSTYARQFLGQMQKPDVDYIEGLSPAISIDQKGPPHNPRSIVGTVTEIYDYLRLLFARIGHPHCPKCGREIQCQTVQQIVDLVQDMPEASRIMILAPLVKDRKGEYQAVFQDLRKAGFVRVRIDGQIYDLSDEFTLDKNKKHTIEAVVDRLQIKKEVSTTRTADSIETALKLGSGVVLIHMLDNTTEPNRVNKGNELLFSEHFACVYCGINLGEIAPRTFSFNSPHGACPACSGLGYKLEIDPKLVIPDLELSLDQGAIQPWARNGAMSNWYSSILQSLGQCYGFSFSTPVKSFSDKQLNAILYGSGGKQFKTTYMNQHGGIYQYQTAFEGVIPNLERRYRETTSDSVRVDIERYMSSNPCSMCQGKRLKPESLAVTVNDRNIMDIASLSVIKTLEWIEELPVHISPREFIIADQIIKEIMSRLGFLRDIGLGYLTLERSSSTLSGGETQRIHLATQIGSGLTGVLYICDEPTVGLHPSDDYKLITTLKHLRDLGNTVIVVEHDESMMRAADYIIDLGPGAGRNGGEIIATGTIEDIMRNPESLTGKYLSGAKQITAPEQRRSGSGE